MKTITMALRDFAVPSPRSGSIEAASGFGRQAVEGQEIHQRLQKRQSKADPLYRAEVPVSSLLQRGAFCFKIDGRMDGIFLHDPPHIQEIKSAFNLGRLVRRLREHPLDHPYCLQLLTYGYFHWREHHIVPRLSLMLVSSRNGHSQSMDLTLDLPRYEGWLERRLDELVLEAEQASQRSLRRRRIAQKFPFPFAAVRPGQKELMDEIEQGMLMGQAMLIQAPTGLGKTVGVLYPVLREALGRGQQVVYVTPKNSQHGVAEDAVARFREAGARLKSLTITAKGKICLQEEPLCDPDVCHYARDYYTRLHEHDISSILARKRRLNARLFRELGQTYRICPYELQLEYLPHADVVICDYNYVFGPRAALRQANGITVEQSGRPNLVIDEAHNLPARAMDYYSPSISCQTLEFMRSEQGRIAPRFRKEADQVLDGCLKALAACRPPACRGPVRIQPPIGLFREEDAHLRAFLARYLETDQELDPQDPVLRLGYSWGEFCAILELAAQPERDEFFVTFHPHQAGGTLKVTCCDASRMLMDAYQGYQQVVAFSATLKPFEYYVRLSGLNNQNVKANEFCSPFPPERRKLLVIPQVSTSYGRRERNYARIADAVQRIAALHQGNYFVFLPSFEFLDRIVPLFKPPPGTLVLRQERRMGKAQVEGVLEQLRRGDAPLVVFAVQGGSFAEGVDYAGDMVIGAFVVGPPLPNYDLEREQMREYYQHRYGAGFEYAYTIPAMARAIQAAGRVIRSEQDRGLIALMDSRFTEPGYSRAMPADWFEKDVSELISDSILRDVARFWEDCDRARGFPTAFQAGAFVGEQDTSEIMRKRDRTGH